MGIIDDSNIGLLSKIATGNGHGEDSLYFDGWKAYDTDPFHLTQNPNGVIQMGLAENQLSFDLIQDWIMKHPQASICTPQGISEFRDIAIFQDYHGLPEFRNAVANFMSKVRGNRVTFNPDRIVMSGGATGAHETVAFCLADPGDAFLVPIPYYPGFDRDLRWRTGVQLLPVMSDSSNDFKITVAAMEEAYNKSKEENIRVKGILITNPSNPLGTILDRDTLKELVKFVTNKNLHLVCDEIYAATAFNQPDFISVAEIIQEMDDCKPELIHIVYSLSKDLGLPGFRVGIVYSYNDAVMNCARKMSSFGLVSTQTQRLVAGLLSDDEFVNNYIFKTADRLSIRHQAFTSGLAQVGIGCLKSNSGLFLWMDLHEMLKAQTFDAEMELWRVIINDVKLNVSPGQSFHCAEPGWFRVCFANMDDEVMEIALMRIREFVAKNGESDLVSKKRRCWKNKVNKLSFKGRIFEDVVAMSPHSPMPQSPLVRAQN